MVTVKKNVLENFIQSLVESRSDGNSYADMTGTMFDINYDDEPVKPKSYMANQFIEAAPDVSDPEYMPGTKGELGRATLLLAKEVPDSQIEYFYRRIHDLLNTTIDRHEDKNMSEELYESLKRILESGLNDEFGDENDEFGDENDAASQWLKQHTAKDAEVTDDSGGDVTDTNTGFKSGTVGDAIIQAKKLGDENVKQIGEFEALQKQLRDKGVIASKVNITPTIERRLKYVAQAAQLAYSEEEVPPELQTLADAAKEWEFDHADAPKYIDAVFLAMHAVYEVNYQLIVANHGLEYGGLEIKEKDSGFGKKLDIGIKQSGTPGSPQHYAGIMEDIQKKYGLTYDNAIRFRSVFNMTELELDRQIYLVLKGLNRFNPTFKVAFKNYSGAIEKHDDEGLKELATLLRMAYKEDVDQEEVQIDTFIAKFFSRIRVKDYYNLTKFTYHAWKDADSIERDYPQQVLALMKKSKFYRAGVFKVTHPNIPEKIKEYSEVEMLEALKTYVKGMVNASVDFHESQIAEKEAMENDYELTPEEEAERRVAKEIKQLEKEGNPQRYTHIAPLYGFNGESGLRQWVLKFPERKMRLMRLGGSDSDNFPGAKKFVRIVDDIYEIVVRNLPLYLSFLNNDEQLEEFTKIFFNLKTKEGKTIGDVSDPAAIEAQMEDFRRIFLSAKNDFQMIDDTLAELDSGDIAIVQAAIENEEPIPFERLTPDVLDYMNENDIEDMVKAYAKGMQGIGGAMARNAVGDILSDVITNTDKPWMMTIAKELETRYESIDAKLAKSLAEHFMGKKNPPDYSSPNKAGTKKFLNLGIGEKEYYEMMAEAIKMYDNIISKYIGKKEKEARSLLFRLKRAELSTLKRQPPEEQKKTISAAHDTYPSIIALGIKSFDDMIMIEKELTSKRQEADQLKSTQIQEIRMLNKLLGVLV
jgi:hypothetical protein